MPKKCFENKIYMDTNFIEEMEFIDKSFPLDNI